MNTFMITLRLVHIALGVFWAGTIFFFVMFLEPSVRAAGPDGARVMQGLQKRQFLNVMPVIAGLRRDQLDRGRPGLGARVCHRGLRDAAGGASSRSSRL
jgi:hypothetical protein